MSGRSRSFRSSRISDAFIRDERVAKMSSQCNMGVSSEFCNAGENHTGQIKSMVLTYNRTLHGGRTTANSQRQDARGRPTFSDLPIFRLSRSCRSCAVAKPSRQHWATHEIGNWPMPASVGPAHSPAGCRSPGRAASAHGSAVSTPSAVTAMSSERPISMIVPTSRRCAVRVNDRLDELAIDLQPTRQELHQADDGGVSGAEIVDLDLDAAFADFREIVEYRVVALVEEDRFQQLERQAPGLDRKCAQGESQLRIVQPAGRDVDRELWDPQVRRHPMLRDREGPAPGSAGRSPPRR